jgi:hypothetical protein
MGNLAERVRQYEPDPVSGETVEEQYLFWPVPQPVIDVNSGAVLKQNQGYN